MIRIDLIRTINGRTSIISRIWHQRAVPPSYAERGYKLLDDSQGL